MGLYNFVFSSRRSTRFKRHLLFWSVWFIYVTITYLVPTNWIPGWNFKASLAHIKIYGITLALVRILFASALHTFMHMALVYGILYYFLPRYLSKNNNRIVTTCLLIVFISFIAFLNYFNFVLAFYMDTQVGFFKNMPDMKFIFPRWIRQVLFNYPSVVGFALAIKLLKNWYLKQEEAAQVSREKISAELQLLKAQVHPHFLFNTLNNIYSFIINGSTNATEILEKLSAMLKYIIYQCDTPLVKLEKELRMIKDYIILEKIRYGENFNMNFQIHGDATNKMICPLVLVPFLENSFKHGASQMLTYPWVNLNIVIEDQQLHFTLSNSKPAVAGEKNSSRGLGLRNVKKRLFILYPETHSLKITEDVMSFTVTLKIPLFQAGEDVRKSTHERAMYELE